MGAIRAGGTDKSGHGIYFTKSPVIAEAYANKEIKFSDYASGHTGAVYPVHLNITNPKIIEKPSFWQKLRDETAEKKQRVKSSYLGPEQISLLQEQGYDGIVNKASDEFVAFHPDQIRSAIRSREPIDDNPVADTIRTGALGGLLENEKSKQLALPAPMKALPAPASRLSNYTTEQLLQMRDKLQNKGQDLPADIQQDEGLRHTSYMDTTGNKTVGYGFNMDSGIARSTWKKAGIQTPFEDVYSGKTHITDADAAALGRTSYGIAMNDAADLYDNFNRLPDNKKAALVNLSYQLGKTNLSKMGAFNSAVNNGQWNLAVRHLFNTKLFTQSPDRTRKTARMLLG